MSKDRTSQDKTSNAKMSKGQNVKETKRWKDKTWKWSIFKDVFHTSFFKSCSIRYTTNNVFRSFDNLRLDVLSCDILFLNSELVRLFIPEVHSRFTPISSSKSSIYSKDCASFFTVNQKIFQFCRMLLKNNFGIFFLNILTAIFSANSQRNSHKTPLRVQLKLFFKEIDYSYCG